MRSNPPWTDRLLKKYWSRIEARVGAGWMPRAMTEPRGLAQLRKDVAGLQAAADKGMTDEYWVKNLYDQKVRLAKLEQQKPKGWEEYGTGHYGCVMPTQTPGVVIKITTDQTEASFVAAYLSLPAKDRPVGIVPYHQIVAVRGESHLKRPVFVLWREEADHLGSDGVRAWIQNEARDFEKKYYSDSLRKTIQLVCNCVDAGRNIRKRIVNQPDARQVLATAVKSMDDVWSRQYPYPPRKGSPRWESIAWLLAVFNQNAQEMMSEPMGNYVGQALHECLDLGLLLADVHLNNIGMPTGKLLEEIGHTTIITDPGHAIALDNRYDGVQIEDL
jgi:hypothetical protein